MNLRALRESKGLTQMNVARKLDVDQGAVSRWESGVTKPVAKHRKKLAKLYGVTVDELLSTGGKDSARKEAR